MSVWLQRYNGKLGREEQLVYQHLIVNNIKATFFDERDLSEYNEKIKDCDLLVGSVESVSSALRMLGSEIPKPNYYPKELVHLLQRNVWESTPLEVISIIAQEKRIFAKPVEWKLFTGQVFDMEDGYSLINSINQQNPSERILLSSVVTWTSEHRIYVKEGEILAICQYMGEDDVEIDAEIVRRAVNQLKRSKGNDSYTFDLGILKDGSVALVEVNDAFSIGAYKGISSHDYYELLRSRWQQMTSQY